MQAALLRVRKRKSLVRRLVVSLLLVGAFLAASAVGPVAKPSMAHAASNPASALLTLSPTSGPPGTVITLTGDVPGWTKAPPPGEGVTICIGSCRTGFTEQLVPVHVLGNGRFTARFPLPVSPVLTATGPLPLTDGTYRIGYTCVGPNVMGCLGSTEASATFRVTHSSERPCSRLHPCAVLTLTPEAAAPGQEVTITGYAPLAPMIGQPFGYNLAILPPGTSSRVPDPTAQVQQAMTGRIVARLRMPAVLPGVGVLRSGPLRLALTYQFNALPSGRHPLPPGVTVATHTKGSVGYEVFTLAPTRFTALPLPTWKRLGTLAPVPGSAQWSQALPLASRGRGVRDLAYCAPDGIRLTQDGGRTFQRIDTAGVDRIARTGPFPLFANTSAVRGQPTCTSLVWDPNDPHTFYATFLAENRIYHSAPPLYQVAYETRDGGTTWLPVPVPRGYTQGDFGGMRQVKLDGKTGVAFVFGRTSPNTPFVTAQTATTQEVSLDGGRTWRVTGLTCPAVGPCIRFGAMPGMLPGMGTADLQPLMRSTNKGRTWTTLAWPSGNLEAQGMLPTGQSQLVALGGDRVAFVDPNSQYPIRISQDGGRTWQPIALPLPPGTAAQVAATGSLPYQVLMWLPDGSLLAAAAQPGAGTMIRARWYVLAPGASTWRLDRALRMPDVLGRLVVAGHALLGLAVQTNGILAFTALLRGVLP